MLSRNDFFRIFEPVQWDATQGNITHRQIQERLMRYSDAREALHKMDIADEDMDDHIWSTVKLSHESAFQGSSINIVPCPEPHEKEPTHFITRIPRRPDDIIGFDMSEWAILSYSDKPLVRLSGNSEFGMTGELDQFSIVIEDGLPGKPYDALLLFDDTEDGILITYRKNGLKVGDLIIDKLSVEALSETSRAKAVDFRLSNTQFRLTTHSDASMHLPWNQDVFLLHKDNITPYEADNLIVEAYGNRVKLYFKEDDVLVNGVSLKQQQHASPDLNSAFSK